MLKYWYRSQEVTLVNQISLLFLLRELLVVDLVECDELATSSAVNH